MHDRANALAQARRREQRTGDAWEVVGIEVMPCSLGHASEDTANKCRPWDENEAPNSEPQRVEAGAKVTITYQVYFEHVDIPWRERWGRYMRFSLDGSRCAAAAVFVAWAAITAAAAVAVARQERAAALSAPDPNTADTTSPRVCVPLSGRVGAGAQVLVAAAVTLTLGCAGLLSPARPGALAGTVLGTLVLASAPAGFVTVRTLRGLWGAERTEPPTLWQLIAVRAASDVIGAPLPVPAKMRLLRRWCCKLQLSLCKQVRGLGRNATRCHAVAAAVGVGASRSSILNPVGDARLVACVILALWLLLMVPLSLLGGAYGVRGTQEPWPSVQGGGKTEPVGDWTCGRTTLAQRALRLHAHVAPAAALLVAWDDVLDGIWRGQLFNLFPYLTLSVAAALTIAASASALATCALPPGPSSVIDERSHADVQALHAPLIGVLHAGLQTSAQARPTSHRTPGTAPLAPRSSCLRGASATSGCGCWMRTANGLPCQERSALWERWELSHTFCTSPLGRCTSRPRGQLRAACARAGMRPTVRTAA